RFTGRDHAEWMCWRWAGTEYVAYPIGLPPPDGFGNPYCMDTSADLWSDVEKGFVEWEVKDINGDGYPDFIYNSSPAEVVSDGPPTDFVSEFYLHPQRFHVRLVGEPDGHPNRVNAVLNVRGLFISGPSSLTATDPFSSPIELLPLEDCGVGLWLGHMD